MVRYRESRTGDLDELAPPVTGKERIVFIVYISRISNILMTGFTDMFDVINTNSIN